MGNIFTEFINASDDETKLLSHPFYTYEPFDIVERAAWIKDLALKDGVDLDAYDFKRLYGKDPHLFQTGIIQGTTKVKAGIAASQSGKTWAAIMAAIIYLTGEIPFCFRYDKGIVTPYKRVISEENIKRWGRITLDGKFLDKDWKAISDGTWDCGLIVGAGKMPPELISTKQDERIWVGCFKEHKLQTWMPGFRTLIPDHCLDKEAIKGGDGFQDNLGKVYLRDGKQFNIITYEQDHRRFESRKVHAIILDEEPPDYKIFESAVRHCKYLIMSFTAYNGVSWSRSRVLEAAMFGKSTKVYHCCAFDSPYLGKQETIDNNRGSSLADRHARMWGIYSSATGKEYFDRKFIVECKKFVQPPMMFGTIYPTKEYGGSPRDLLKMDLSLTREMDSVEDRYSFETRNVWEIYEDVLPGSGYFATVDLAKGCDDPNDRKDRSVIYIFKSCIDNEHFLFQPQMVAALRSFSEQFQFSSLALYGCAYYNNATLFPENKGEDCGAFNAYTREWPFYGTMTVINSKTDRPTETLGFVTGGENRRYILNSVKEQLATCTPDDNPFLHPPLLEEMIGFGWRNNRPDHARHGTSDCIMAYAISRWIWTYNAHELRCNKAIVCENSWTKTPFSVIAGENKKATTASYGVQLGYGKQT